MQLKHIIALCTIAAILPGCYKRSGYWKNEQIDPSVRSELHALNDQLFNYLKTNDWEHLKYIESKTILNASDGAVRQLDEVANYVKGSDYTIFDEYYVVNRYKDEDTIVNHSRGINSYSVYYQGTTHEMYVAYLLPKTGNTKYMITVVFCKFSYGWKLNALDISLYSINGKTGPELYVLAEQEYDKGYLINSANLVQLANSCANPSSWWNYDKFDEITQAYQKIAMEASQKFASAIVLNNVPTHPKLVKIFEDEFRDGYYPMVYYQTSINVNDTVAIRKENNEIMKELPKVAPGIDKDTPWLLFRAFNKLPNAQENVPRYEMDNRVGK